MMPSCARCKQPSQVIDPRGLFLCRVCYVTPLDLPKSDYNMLPPRAVRAVVNIFSSCGKGRPHWITEDVSQTYDISAAMRHLEAHRAGETLSEEGHLHIAHAAARMLMVLEKVIRNGPEATVWNARVDSPANCVAPTGPAPDAEPATGGGRAPTSTKMDIACIAVHRPGVRCRRCGRQDDDE